MTIMAALLLGVSISGLQQSCADDVKPPVFELRTYTAAEGKIDALHARFRDHTIELFKKHGMDNVAYWTPVDDPNTLVYLLGHKSREAAKASWKGFMGDPDWQKAYKASTADGRLVTKVESQFLKLNDYSPIQTTHFQKSVKGKGLLYELRTYTTNPGKGPNINARFRDHTIALFEKHGIQNLIYTTPIDEKLSKNTLVYLIAHKDADAAQVSWKSFGSDPAWKKVAAESQVDGRILIKGGVKRQYLNLTDYSPLK